MTDIAPQLWEKIENEFNRLYNEDERIQRFLSQMEKGTAVSDDAAHYAMYVGEVASKSLLKHLTEKNLPNGRLYFNIADRTVRPMIELIHKLVNDAAVAVMEAEYRAAGIGLKPQRTDFPEDRCRGLIDKLASYFEDEDNGI